jgi:hypothetical protein
VFQQFDGQQRIVEHRIAGRRVGGSWHVGQQRGGGQRPSCGSQRPCGERPASIQRGRGQHT